MGEGGKERERGRGSPEAAKVAVPLPSLVESRGASPSFQSKSELRHFFFFGFIECSWQHCCRFQPKIAKKKKKCNSEVGNGIVDFTR